MARIELRNVSKIYGTNTEAVKGVNLTVEDGEFVVLAGPSGCGKSTTLRMIAGLESVSGGEILADGARINDVPVQKRDMAMVFQQYALYENMTVFENIAFPLRMRKRPKEEIRRQVEETAELLDLSRLLSRRPAQLSGGERQRAAMGRAMIRRPKVFLMDEPLSNLDAKLRIQLRAEIAALHQRLGTTTIYVTHDQAEAMSLADRIVVMKEGEIAQVGTAAEIYEHPNSAFVAGFFGNVPMNFFRRDGKLYGIRPEHIMLTDKLPDGRVSDFSLDRWTEAELLCCEYFGAEQVCHLRIGEERFTAARFTEKELSPGRVWIKLLSDRVMIFD